MTEKHVFSASQIKLFKSCKLCWAYQYLNGVKQEAGPAAAMGSAIHKLLEDYLRDGKEIDLEAKYAKIAIPGIKHLPAPRTCEVEHGFHFDYEEVSFRGFIDFYYKKGDLWVVGDHKTTSNFRYALSERVLSEDVQASLYAYYIMQKEQCDAVELDWVYYLTRGTPTSKLVTCNMGLTQAQENVKLVLDDCREMLDAKSKGLTAADFEPPPSGCKAFGPCAAILLENERKGSGNMSNAKRSLTDFLDKKLPKEEAPSFVVAEESFSFDHEAEPANREEALETLVEEGQARGDYEDKGWFLFVDCLPRQGFDSIVELSTLLKPVFKMIAKEYNVSHPSFIPYESLGVYVTRLDKYLTQNPIKPGTAVLMSSGNWGASNALDVLIAHGPRVVQG